jgi:hypothetical protein
MTTLEAKDDARNGREACQVYKEVDIPFSRSDNNRAQARIRVCDVRFRRRRSPTFLVTNTSYPKELIVDRQ